MVKYKILSAVLATMLVISGGKILLLKSEKLNIGNKLVQTSSAVSGYVTKVDNTLNKNKIDIKTLEKNNNNLKEKNKEINNINKETESKNKQLESENAILNNKITQLEKSNNKFQNEESVEEKKNINLTNINESLNSKIKNLLDALAISEGNSDYKNMSSTKQTQIIATLLHYWGYGQRTSNIIARILEDASEFAVEPSSNNSVVQNNKVSQKNNMIQKNDISQKNDMTQENDEVRKENSLEKNN